MPTSPKLPKVRAGPALKLFDTLGDEFKEAGIDEVMMAKIKAQAASMYANKELVEQLSTKEAQLFFLATGKRFEGKKPLEFKDKLPNLFGGDPFPSLARLAVKEVDKKLGYVKISWTQTLEPKEARRIVEKTLKDMAKRLGKDVPEDKLPKTLTVEESGEFTVELSTAWTQSFTHKRKASTETGSQEESITVSRKKN